MIFLCFGTIFCQILIWKYFLSSRMTGFTTFSTSDTGCPYKISHSVCFISLATSMLGGWGIIHLKGVIHSSVWILYDIWEQR